MLIPQATQGLSNKPQSNAKFSDPHTKTFLLLQAHLSRIQLPDECLVST